MNISLRWEALRSALEAQKTAVAAEIEAYPRPIAGCDAQFNHLLERRRLLWEELSRLEAASREHASGVEEFVRGSTCLDPEAKRAILEAIELAVGPPS
jgi:hypothetical protein